MDQILKKHRVFSEKAYRTTLDSLPIELDIEEG
jgi:hypothetical protein